VSNDIAVVEGTTGSRDAPSGTGQWVSAEAILSPNHGKRKRTLNFDAPRRHAPRILAILNARPAHRRNEIGRPHYLFLISPALGERLETDSRGDERDLAHVGRSRRGALARVTTARRYWMANMLGLYNMQDLLIALLITPS